MIVLSFFLTLALNYCVSVSNTKVLRSPVGVPLIVTRGHSTLILTYTTFPIIPCPDSSLIAFTCISSPHQSHSIRMTHTLMVFKCFLSFCVFLVFLLCLRVLTLDCYPVFDYLLLALTFACYLNYSFSLALDIVVCLFLTMPVRLNFE